MPLLPTTIVLALAAAAANVDLLPRIVEADGHGSATAPLTGLYKPVLTSFSLGYDNGDHEVRTIAVKTVGEDVVGTLADQNADDPMSMRVGYTGVEWHRSFRTTAACNGTCSLAIEPPPSSLAGTKRLALVGFEVSVSSTSDRDRRIRMLSIRPSADERTFRVEMRDNTSYAYNVTIDYAWIVGTSASKVTDMAQRTAAERSQQVPIGRPASPNVHSFIAGFSVEFTNGEHNLRDLAFEPDASGQYFVRFNDNNFDDPMRATLDRVMLRR